jgi:hypothetical protein
MFDDGIASHRPCRAGWNMERVYHGRVDCSGEVGHRFVSSLYDYFYYFLSFCFSVSVSFSFSFCSFFFLFLILICTHTLCLASQAVPAPASSSPIFLSHLSQPPMCSTVLAHPAKILLCRRRFSGTMYASMSPDCVFAVWIPMDAKSWR